MIILVSFVQSLSCWKGFLELYHFYDSHNTFRTLPLLQLYFLLLQVVFSYESTISVLDDRERSVRRWSGEEFKLHCLKKTVKLPPKIIVWGAISANGTSRLHIVEGTKNATEYIEGSIGRLLPQVMEWYGANPWMF